MLTRIPSGASDCARFLLRLVIAAFDAVYATRLGDWRRVEWAETFTIRAHAAARSSGSAARTQRTALERADVERREPLVVVEVLEALDADLDRARPRSTSACTSPQRSAQLVERGVDLVAAA